MPFHARKHRPLSLALQGGGAHGAFTWGVLDALLEDGRVEFRGVSGTSAGAMNAVAMAHGLLHGGRDGARESLANFWHAVANGALPLDTGIDVWSDALGAGLAAALHWSRLLSPKQLNPMDINPLRQIVTSQFDFERLRAASPVRLFVAATHANSGRLRLFRTQELSASAVLASACLPSLHHPVEIDGEPYWDGGYSANPAIFPLLYECDASDVLLVLLSPMEHRGTPHTTDEIGLRAQELAFKSGFLREMGAIAQARRYARGWLPAFGRLERRLARTKFHLIAGGELTDQLAPASKLTAWRPFLETLRDHGRSYAAAWLAQHWRALGRRSSLDIEAMFP